MTWLPVDTKAAASESEAVLGLYPDAYAKHQVFLQTCATALDPALLELCRARMAQLLHCREESSRFDDAYLSRLDRWYEDESFTDLEQAAVGFVEQFILDPALVTAEMAAPLERALGASGVVDFTTIVASFEAAIRLSVLLDLEP